jgi:hypothetical protein
MHRGGAEENRGGGEKGRSKAAGRAAEEATGGVRPSTIQRQPELRLQGKRWRFPPGGMEELEVEGKGTGQE